MDFSANMPTEGNVTAINVPHASMVFDLHDRVEITAELLNGGGRATEVVRFADIVSFTCLKVFAFDQRAEPKGTRMTSSIAWSIMKAARTPSTARSAPLWKESMAL